MLPNYLHYAGQQLFAVYAFVLGIGIGKMGTNIAKVGGSKQCIANYMDQHIGIGMAYGTMGKGRRYFHQSNYY